MFHRDVAKGIHPIDEHFLNFYLIEEGGRITIVDAGLPASWDSLLEALVHRGRVHVRQGHTRRSVDGGHPARGVYLPPGRWIDYQSGQAYQGAGWHRIRAGEVPVVMLVKDGAAIRHIRLAQSTADMNWREIELVVFSVEASAAEAWLCLPEEGQLHALRLEREDDEGDFVLTEDPLQSRVEWRIRYAPAES